MEQYTDTDQRLHLLCQVITKTNRTFIPKKEDDSHTNLYFDALGHRITGRWIATKNDQVLFTLNLKNLAIEIVNGSQTVLISIPFMGKKIDEIEKEIEQQLPLLGLNAAGFTEKLHYEIPEYSFSAEPVSLIEIEALGSWKHFRQLANNACALLLGHTQVPGEIRIWPHHFDTGVYIEPNNNIGLGFGLAMADSLVSGPYFYFSASGLNGNNFKYPTHINLEAGKWILNDNWQGAVLPLVELQGNDIKKITQFITQVSQCFLQEAK